MRATPPPMTQRAIEPSPQAWARIGGVLYLVIIIIGIWAEVFVRDGLILSGDVTTTARNIAASQGLWRAAIAANLVHLSSGVILAAIYYLLFAPVSKTFARIAVLFNLTAIALEAGGKVFLLLALAPLGSAEYLKAFEPQQLHVLTWLSIRGHTLAFNVSLIFFGFQCVILGYLIFKSTFLPRLLGVLMALAGVSYLVNCFAVVVAPSFADIRLLIPAFIGETALCLWLIFKGIDAPRWREWASTKA